MKKYLFTALKGIAMGAADVIPGVSGGTIAFMTGIYEELINSIKSVNFQAMKKLFKGEFRAFWRDINGNFLLAIISGIMVSIFSLARLMQYLLATHPVPLWSFFMGLIVASAVFILSGINKWSISGLIFLASGIAIAGYICLVSPRETTDVLWFIFFSGAIAVCAMILPGISGSFILLLLGKYAYMMEAVNTFNIRILLVFAAGAVIGILLFSNFISWLLKKYYNQTIFLLSGFMIGSIIKLWPWKRVLDDIYMIDRPVLPSHFESITGQDAHVFQALLFALLGFFIVLAIEFAAKAMRR